MTDVDIRNRPSKTHAPACVFRLGLPRRKIFLPIQRICDAGVEKKIKLVQSRSYEWFDKERISVKQKWFMPACIIFAMKRTFFSVFYCLFRLLFVSYHCGLVSTLDRRYKLRTDRFIQTMLKIATKIFFISKIQRQFKNVNIWHLISGFVDWDSVTWAYSSD